MDNKAFVSGCDKDLKLIYYLTKTDELSKGKKYQDTSNRQEILDTNKSNSNTEIGLKRDIGLFSAISMILGVMIGSGIFVSPGGLLKQTGSVSLSLIVWAACGLLSTFGAVSYIELGTVVPCSGAEYNYLLMAFGDVAAFLFSWTSTIVLKPAGVAILCLAFAHYTVEPFVGDASSFPWTVILVASAALLILMFISCTSVELAVNVQNVLTIAKLTAVTVIVGGGVYNVISGKTENFLGGFEGSIWNFGSIASAFYSGLWSFEGWNNLNYIIEEIKDPHRNLPRAVLIAMPLVTGCYLLVNVAYLTVMTPVEIVESSAVAIVFGKRVLGSVALLVPLSVALSTFGSANGSLFAAGRLCYAAATRGHLVDCLSYIQIRRNVPSIAIIFNGVLGFFMVVALPIEQLIDFFGFTAWIFYGATAAALLRLRFTLPDAPRPFKAPTWMPVMVLFSSIFLVVAPIMENPKWEHLYASVFIFSGLVLYVPFVHFRYVFPGTDCTTKFLQKCLLVLPPERGCTGILSQSPKDLCVNTEHEKKM